MVPPDFGVPVGAVAPSVPTTLVEAEEPGPESALPAAPVDDDPPQAERATARTSAIAAAMAPRSARRGARGWALLEERFLSCLFMLWTKLELVDRLSQKRDMAL